MIYLRANPLYLQVAAVVPASSHPSIAVADTTLPIVEVVTALEKWYVAVPIVTVAGYNQLSVYRIGINRKGNIPQR